MALHRFFVPTECFTPGRVHLTSDTARQVARVLRLRVGDEIVALDDSGQEFLVRLDHVSDRAAGGDVVEIRLGRGEPGVQITLYQALVSRERFELALQKGTEVGISRFVPTWCARSQIGMDAVTEARLERWRRLVRETAEQCHRARLPNVQPGLALSEALARAVTDGPALVAWEQEDQRGTASVLSSLGRVERLSLFVGPEGGFTSAEIEEAQRQGVQTIGLGPRLLRAETAGPLLATLVLFASGDLDDAYQRLGDQPPR